MCAAGGCRRASDFQFTVERARATTSVTTLADLIHSALVADLPAAATACIELLQAAGVNASDITDLMRSVAPLVRVLRYGSARALPESELRALIHSLSVESMPGFASVRVISTRRWPRRGLRRWKLSTRR